MIVRTRIRIGWILLLPAWLCATGANAQVDRESDQRDDSAGSMRDELPRLDQTPIPPGLDYDSEPPYTLYERQWNRRFAKPYRQPFREEYYPFGRPYYPRRYYSPYAYPPSYGYWRGESEPYGYRGAVPFDDGYEEGFHDGRRFQKWQHKAELGATSYMNAMRRGKEAFRQADYGVAARQFILAAKLNQGDAAARLHAVHAMVALGRYEEAVPALRRAVQLQPRLVYLPLDIRSEYGPASDFDVHLSRLAKAAEAEPGDANLCLLLGYYYFFSARPGEAEALLKRAAELAPDDTASWELYDAVRFSTPAEPRERRNEPTISEPSV